MVTLATVEQALKELYLGPIINELNTDTDPFITRIKRTSERIVGNNGIIRDAQIGMNGGFGAGTETGELPAPGENIYKKLKSTTKNLYGVISVSHKALKALDNDSRKGAFDNMVQRDIDTMMATAKYHFARQTSGSSTGVLTKTKTGSGNSFGVDDTRLLIEGIQIDILSSSGSPVAQKRRILNINRKTNTVTISGAAVSVEAGMLVTVQGSYGLELTGLDDLFNVDGLTTLYGLTRADNDWLNPHVETASDPISDVLLTEIITRQEDAYNVNINYLRAGNDAYNAYAKYLESRARIVNTTIYEGGYKGLKFGELPLIRSKFTEKDSIDFLDTEAFTIDQVSEWDWIPGPTNGIFVQLGNTPTFNATLAKYADLMCDKPGGMARLKGVTAPATGE